LLNYTIIEVVGNMSEQKQRKYDYMISVGLDNKLKERLWNYIKKSRPTPYRALANIVREALIEYLDRHEKELEQQTITQ
jgi:hypothetical protein